MKGKVINLTIKFDFIQSIMLLTGHFINSNARITLKIVFVYLLFFFKKKNLNTEFLLIDFYFFE